MASQVPAQSDASLAALIPLGSHAKSAPIDLKRPITVIGSRKDVVRLHLQSSTVSNAHAVVVLNAWGCYVHDLGSRTGTLVNGKPVTDADLADGDTLQIGRFQFKYRAPQRTQSKPRPLDPTDLIVSTTPVPFVLTKRVSVIGRRAGSDVRFDTSQASNIHALIVEQDGRRIIRDVGSRTGTWLDDKPIHQEVLPPGTPLRVADATLTLTPRGGPAAKPAAEPISLADAAAPPAAGLDAPAAALALGALELEPPPDETAAGDDLASLRRGWKAPSRADDLIPAPPAATPEPAARAPAPAKPAEPVAPAPLELEPLRPKPAEPAPPLPAAEAPETPAVEVPAEAADADFEPLDLDLLTGPTVAEAEPIERDEPSAAEPARAPGPAAVPLEPQAERPAVDVPAETPAGVEDDTLAVVPAEAEADIDVPLAAEPEAVAQAELVAEAQPVAEDVTAEADLEPLDLSDLEVARDPDAPALPEEAAAVAGEETDAVVADPDAPVFDATPVAEPDEAAAAPPAVATDAPSWAVDTEEPATDESAADDEVEGIAADSSAGPAVAGLGLEPLDLSDIELARDPDAPTLPAEETAEAAEPDADAVIDPDAPAIAAAAVEESRPPVGLESLPPEADEPAEMPAVATLSPEVEIDAVADEAELAPLDLSDLQLERDADAPAADAAAEAEVDALVPDPEAPALETPEISGRHAVSDTHAGVSDRPDVDQVDLEADEREADAETLADANGEAVVEEAVVESQTPEAAAASTVAARPEPPLTPSDTLILDEAVRRPEDDDDAASPVEPDLIRLTEDMDDETNEATALAVDLGLVLDEEPPPVTPAPGPATPVEIDLTASRRDDSVEPPRLGPLGSAAGPFEPAVPAAGHPAEDVFDADAVEETPESPGPAEPLAPAAEAPAGDDHIEAPRGGSLSDLIPSGPPLLGGSFMSMPQPLPRPAEPPGRRRPLRVGFGAEPQRPSAAPFAAERTIADAAGAPAHVDDEINGLAAARPSADAFGASPVTHSNGTPFAEELPALPVERFRPRGVIRPVVPGRPSVDEAPPAAEVDLVDANQSVTPAAVYSAENELLRARRHRRRVRVVIACLVAMIVLIGGAAWGVYYFTPLKSTVDALIGFDGLDRLGIEERAQFQGRQDTLLVSEKVRTEAIASLPPSVTDVGFLVGRKAVYDTVISDPKIRWPGDQLTQMRLRVRSTDEVNDVYRLRALGDELIKAATPDVKRKGELTALANDDKNESDARRRQYNDLNDQIQALQQASGNRPAVKSASELNEEYLQAEPALTSIKAARQELEATIDRLQKPASRTAPGGPAPDSAAADQEINKLTLQLNDLQQATTRPAAAGDEARKSLDASIAALERNLADAQKLRDNPQLTAYVESASRMFKQMRDFTESLIRRQETNRTQLMELKTRMSENLQNRTQELLAKDTELKKLKDSLAIAERQYNAANASGFGDEAAKKQLELRLLKVKVAERQDQYSNDSVYTPAIASLQQLIDRQEGQIRADRKDIDDRLTDLQGDFLKSAPAVEKMPAEQKALAEGIEAKMKAMNDARRAYAAATEAAQQAQAKAEADTKERVNALRLQIAARRQDVLTAAAVRQAQDDESTRQKKLLDTQAELAQVRLSEQNAAHRVAAATAAIEANEKQRRVNAQADADRQAKLAQRDDVERKMRSAQSSLATHQAQLARLIVPDPAKVDILTDRDPDRRPLMAGAIAGGIAVLLMIPMLLNLLALSREAHGHPEPNADAGDGFEPVRVDAEPRKALPQPASVG